MTKANIKRAKKDIARQIETDALHGEIHYGSSCDDMSFTVTNIRLNYGKRNVGRATLIASGVTCKGTDWYPNGSPFIEYNQVVFTYSVDPKNGTVMVSNWWVKF